MGASSSTAIPIADSRPCAPKGFSPPWTQSILQMKHSKTMKDEPSHIESICNDGLYCDWLSLRELSRNTMRTTNDESQNILHHVTRRLVYAWLGHTTADIIQQMDHMIRVIQRHHALLPWHTPDQYGLTPLHLMAKLSSPFLLPALEAKVNPNVFTSNDDTPLMLLCQFGDNDRLSPRDVAAARTLVNLGCPMNHRSRITGECALTHAIHSGKALIVTYLLSKNVTIPSTIYDAPMRHAIASVIAAYLFFSGASVQPSPLYPSSSSSHTTAIAAIATSTTSTHLLWSVLPVDCFTVITEYLIPDLWPTLSPHASDDEQEETDDDSDMRQVMRRRSDSPSPPPKKRMRPKRRFAALRQAQEREADRLRAAATAAAATAATATATATADTTDTGTDTCTTTTIATRTTTTSVAPIAIATPVSSSPTTNPCDDK